MEHSVRLVKTRNVNKIFVNSVRMISKLWFPILVIKYAYKVDDRVGATELIIKLKPKVAER